MSFIRLRFHLFFDRRVRRRVHRHHRRIARARVRVVGGVSGRRERYRNHAAGARADAADRLDAARTVSTLADIGFGNGCTIIFYIIIIIIISIEVPSLVSSKFLSLGFFFFSFPPKYLSLSPASSRFSIDLRTPSGHKLQYNNVITCDHNIILNIYRYINMNNRSRARVLY